MARTPHRIAYVIGELGTGGAEYQLYELLRCLDRGRWGVRVFALSRGGYWAEPIRRLGIDVVELVRRGSIELGRVVRLRRELRAFAPHLLHTILWPGNTYGRLAALGLGIPVVIAAERNAIERPPRQVAVERALDRATTAYLVNCEAVAAVLVGRERLPREKVRVVPNGIDLARLPPFVLDRTPARRALGFVPTRRVVAQVGRLTAQKDYPTFLRAAALVARELSDVDFLAVGDGEDRAALQALAEGLGLEGRLRFTGVRHDVPVLLGAADVLALCSRFEGFPNVLMEAMAMGAVAVASDVGGARELMEPGVSGLLVPAGTPEAVASAILEVLRTPDRARRLAEEARRRIAERFAVETMARRTVAVYEELLRAAGAAAPA